MLYKKIDSSIKKEKFIQNDWNYNYLECINECINIENHIKDIYNFSDILKKCKLNRKVIIGFSSDENSFNNIIKSFGNISKIFHYIYELKECPPDLDEDRIYSL